MSKTTIKIYPNDRKRSVKTQKVPLYMIVTKNGVKTESRLDWELISSEHKKWNFDLERVDIKETYTNTFLQKIEMRFTQLKLSDTKQINEMSVYEIKDYLLGVESNSKRVMSIDKYAREYYNVSIDQSNRFAEATKINYRKALNHLEAFIKKDGLEHKRISSLDFDFANKFSAYLMSNDNRNGRIGMSEASACGIIKKFRTIFNQAVQEDCITLNPFHQIKLSYKSPEKPTLSLRQFKLMIESSINYKSIWNVSDTQRTPERSFDERETMIMENEIMITRLFLLMSLTGCAFVDFINLTHKNIEKMDEQNIRLVYKRKKTGLESQQILTKQAIELFEVLEENPVVQSSDFLVPRVSNQHYNRTLKTIASKLNIHFNLTSHSARHNFRALLDEADIVDPSVVYRLMGWSNKKGMDSIYRRVTDTRLIKTKEQFEVFLDSLFK